MIILQFTWNITSLYQILGYQDDIINFFDKSLIGLYDCLGKPI